MVIFWMFEPINLYMTGNCSVKLTVNSYVTSVHFSASIAALIPVALFPLLGITTYVWWLVNFIFISHFLPAPTKHASTTWRWIYATWWLGLTKLTTTIGHKHDVFRRSHHGHCTGTFQLASANCAQGDHLLWFERQKVSFPARHFNGQPRPWMFQFDGRHYVGDHVFVDVDQQYCNHCDDDPNRGLDSVGNL